MVVALSIDSTVYLPRSGTFWDSKQPRLVIMLNRAWYLGIDMPILGLGVYLNHDCIPACLAALDAGYRYTPTARVQTGQR